MEDHVERTPVMEVIRIAVVGAECTGKTDLCQALAKHFNGLWVPEYLREFCDAQGRTPTAMEQIHILLTQQTREAQVLAQATKKNKRWVFCDSAPLATALYSQLLFEDPGLTRAAVEHHAHYAATLHCAPDIAWQPDGVQRDGEQARTQFEAALTISFTEHDIATHRVAGLGDARLDVAVAALQELAAHATLGVPQNPVAETVAAGDASEEDA
jgi:nicotinamide riboside kinase